MDYKKVQDFEPCLSLPSHLLRARNPSSKSWTRFTLRSRTNFVKSWSRKNIGSPPNNILLYIRVYAQLDMPVFGV